MPCPPAPQHPARLWLGEDDAAEHEGHAEDVDRPERLAEEDHPEHGADDGVEQADDGHRPGTHPGEAAEPRDVGDARPHETEVGEREPAGEVERRRGSLDGERDRREEQAAGDELP